MIRLQLIKQGKNIAGFQLSGHAGYAPSGSDIVCAAASFLAITVVNSLEVQLGIAPLVRSEDGFLDCRLPQGLCAAQQSTAQIILRTMATGFQNLQETYPAYILIQNVRIKGGALE